MVRLSSDEAGVSGLAPVLRPVLAAGTGAAPAGRPVPGDDNWLIGAPVKRSLIAFDHV